MEITIQNLTGTRGGECVVGEMMPVYVILLAGGSGTRLWPVSRQLYPKQLACFSGEYSLIQSTIIRLDSIIDNDRIFVVCGESHSMEISRQLEALGIETQKRILTEPFPRNTAPAIALAVASILEKDSDALLCVFPADHVIQFNDRFQKQVISALSLADAGYIVTFGIKPHYPETGYGYIEGGKPVTHGALLIKRFVEKPDQKTADQYIQAGNFFWNSGMFAFRASVVVKEFEAYCPFLYEQIKRYLRSDDNERQEIYKSLENISIDYAVMEKTTRGVVLPSDFGWSDIGSWKSLYDFLEKDENGNVIMGDVVLKDTHNSLIVGQSRLIAASRIVNTVVVETPDAVLVSDLENSRDVKSIVDALTEKNRPECRQHRTLFYSWGSKTMVLEAADCCVQRLIINPGATCRLKRAINRRHIIVTKGTAEIKSDRDKQIVAPEEFTTVPEGFAADICNTGKNELILMEIVKADGKKEEA
jgi:mannose-1-phosphate guanylyltransferase/mannose-1-phosphate guanylyltransferase/mannose-6-phosphate isomerase